MDDTGDRPKRTPATAPGTANVVLAHELLRLAGALLVEQLVAHLSDDAVLELPFAPGQMPRRHEGKAAIRRTLLEMRSLLSDFAMHIDAVYETSDPSVVIAEHHSEGTVAANKRAYKNRYVTFYTFGADGLVVNWREYFDGGVIVRAFGR